MSVDWIGTVAASAVGIAGIWSTQRATSSNNDTTLKIAREERIQRRIEQSYTELQRVVNLFGQWAEATMPMFTLPGQDPHPSPPSNDELQIAAALQIYWSPEIRDLAAKWTQARNKLLINSSVARTEKLEGRHAAEQWKQVPEQKVALKGAEDALLARMYQELMGETEIHQRQGVPHRMRPRRRAGRPVTLNAPSPGDSPSSPS